MHDLHYFLLILRSEKKKEEHFILRSKHPHLSTWSNGRRWFLFEGKKNPKSKIWVIRNMRKRL